MAQPNITVLMPVYNGASYVGEAVESILSQTMVDFELLVIDDGSIDNSREILEQFRDDRIRLVCQANQGLAATLNRGISLARGVYIARQDQDDISRPSRLEKQQEFMERHPDVGLLGTAAEIWVGNTPSERAHDHPTEHAELCFELLFNNPFVHSSVMIRRSAVERVGGYATEKSRQPPEDYELWSRMARKYEVANLGERLLVYREVPESMSRLGPNPFLERLVTICSENIAHASGLATPDIVCSDIAALTHSAYHRLSRKPDIGRMCDTIRRAGMTMACSGGNDHIAERTEERITNLRYQFMIYRTNSAWVRPIFRTLKSVLKKIRLS